MSMNTTPTDTGQAIVTKRRSQRTIEHVHLLAGDLRTCTPRVRAKRGAFVGGIIHG